MVRSLDVNQRATSPACGNRRLDLARAAGDGVDNRSCLLCYHEGRHNQEEQNEQLHHLLNNAINPINLNIRR